jgi:hypothetical protein
MKYFSARRWSAGLSLSQILAYEEAIESFFNDNVFAVTYGYNSAWRPAASVSMTKATADLLTQMHNVMGKKIARVGHLKIYRKAVLADATTNTRTAFMTINGAMLDTALPPTASSPSSTWDTPSRRTLSSTATPKASSRPEMSVPSDRLKSPLLMISVGTWDSVSVVGNTRRCT